MAALSVPFKYLKILLTAVHCSGFGLDMKRLTQPTAKAMSGRVPTIAYISLPTALL
jgi:hypothetical protein